MDYVISYNLLISSQVASILGVTRQRVQQMVVEKILPPKYVFNKSSNHKSYLFDKGTVLKYSMKEMRKSVVWKKPSSTTLMSIPEIINFLQCPETWVYDITRRGSLKPDIVAGEQGKRLLCLYERKNVLKAWKGRIPQGGITGPRKSTVNLIKKIVRLNVEGLSDSEIARRLGCKQPRIAKLRKESGLESACKRGRPSNSRGDEPSVIDTIKIGDSNGSDVIRD